MYRDFSHVSSPEAAAAAAGALMADELPDGRHPTQGSDRNFPSKLHYALSSIEADGQAHIVGWLPHGRSFAVHKHKEFVDDVLNCWFRQTKFTSFQRQLNLYGFKRITKGPDTGSYYHPLFLRGKPFLADRIPRQEIKGRGPYRPEPFRQEPNFYSLPFLPPTPSAGNQQEARASTSGDGQPQAALPLALHASAPPVLSMLGTNAGLGVLPAGLSLIQPLMAASTPASGIDAKKPAGLLQATSSLMREWPATVQQRNEQLTSGLLAPDNTAVMLYAMALRRRQLEEERLMVLQQPYRSTAPLQPRTTMLSSSSGAPSSGAMLTTSALLAMLQTRHQREQQQVQASSSLGNVGALGLNNGLSIGNNELDAIGRARLEAFLFGSRSGGL